MKHFIFDLDGTLIDTERAVLKTWRKTLSEYGYDFSTEDLKCVLGVTSVIGLQRLNVEADENYMDLWQRNYADHAKDTDYFAGTKEMLLQLKQKGCTVGAVSSRCKKEYIDFFSDFDFEEIFDVVVLEDDTQSHKPNPEPLLKYLEIMKADKNDSIYIGDMPGDIECANSAGVISGLVTWNRSGVICKEAKLIFETPEEVTALAES